MKVSAASHKLIKIKWIYSLSFFNHTEEEVSKGRSFSIWEWSIPQLLQHLCTGYRRTPYSHLVLEKSLLHFCVCPLQSQKCMCMWDSVSGKEEPKPSLCKSQDCSLPVMGSSKSENKTADELCTQETCPYPNKEDWQTSHKGHSYWLWILQRLLSVLLGYAE